MIMRTEYIEYVVEIADKGSINKASQSLNFAPQKLCRILSVVEKECGYKIFDRTNKGVFITEKGEAFLQNARKVLSIVEDIYYPDLKNESSEIIEDMSIYHMHSTPTEFLLPAIVDFIDRYPGVNLTFNETCYSNIICEVRNSTKLKIGMVAYTYPFDNYELLFENILFDLAFVPFLKTKPVVVFSEKHPFYNRYQKISLKTLIQHPFTILKSNDTLEDNVTYKILKNYGEPKIKYAVTNLDLYYKLLERGNTFGLAAEKNVSSNELKKIQLVENIGYMVGFVINKNNLENTMVKVFFDNMEAVLKNMINSPL